MPKLKLSRRARDRRWHFIRSAKKMSMPPRILALVVARAPKVCAICARKRKLVNDHSHKFKAYRGRVCHGCNTAMGLMDDDPQRLRNAAEYLDRNNRPYGPATTKP